MGEIAAFVSGCVFSLLLAGGCVFMSVKVVEYRETGEERRENRRNAYAKKAYREPEGGVIRPMTQEEIDQAADEELNEVRKILG